MDLLPETDFRLFAVSVRFPHNLAQQVELRPIQEGVYEVRHFTGTLRVVVVHQLPEREHNAMLHLFSARPDQFRYGAMHHRVRSAEASTLPYQLFECYRLERLLMPDTRGRPLSSLALIYQILQKHRQEGQMMPDMLDKLVEETIVEILDKVPLSDLPVIRAIFSGLGAS